MAVGKKEKKPKMAVSVSPSKTPVAQPVADFNKLYPAWRVARLEMCDPFGWHEVNKSKLDDIRKRLSELEKLTWKEILIDQNHWNHIVQIGNLTKEARERLSSLRLDDLDEVISLRLSWAERIWGYKFKDALTLLWYDPKHDVWDDKS